MKNFIKFWLPLILYAGLIFFVSSLQGNELKLPAFWNADKVLHMAAYAVFGLLVARVADYKKPDMKLAGLAFWIIAGTSLYGASDELHQYFVPLRTCTFGDWLADSLGGAAAFIIWRFWKSSKKNKDKLEKKASI